MHSLRSLLVVLCITACSSSPTETSQAKDPAPADTSVYDSCLAFASRLCADAEGCCQGAHGGFDQDACVATFQRDVCRPGADAVKAGKATFNEASIDACLAAHAKAHEICVPTWPETLALRKEIYTACRVIDGTTEPGRGCAIATTCQRPEGLATTECVKNVCVVIEILPEGAACPFPQGPVSVCDAGLACDAAGPEEQGTCQKAIATGATCDGSVLEGRECGLGSYCDQQTSQCRVTDNLGGIGCAQSTECVSFECNRLANTCDTAPAVISRDTCLGAP